MGLWSAMAWEQARRRLAWWLQGLWGGVALQEPGALIAGGMPEGAATGCRRESEYGPRGAHACGTWQVDVLVAEVEKQMAGKAKKGGDKEAKKGGDKGGDKGGKKKKGGVLDKDYCLRFSAYGPGPVPSELCGRCAAARRGRRVTGGRGWQAVPFAAGGVDGGGTRSAR